MEEYFNLIETNIKAAGYTKAVDGEEIYNEICDAMEDKEPGSYIFMSKKTDTVFFEYKIDVLEDQFNLSYIRINEGAQSYFVDFDRDFI